MVFQKERGPSQAVVFHPSLLFFPRDSESNLRPRGGFDPKIGPPLNPLNGFGKFKPNGPAMASDHTATELAQNALLQILERDFPRWETRVYTFKPGYRVNE